VVKPIQSFAAQHFPGHHLLLENLATDLLSLFLFSLSLQTLRLLPPLVQVGVLGLQLQAAPGEPQFEQIKQPLPGGPLDQVDIAHRAGDCHIQGIDMEFINLQ